MGILSKFEGKVSFFNKNSSNYKKLHYTTISCHPSQFHGHLTRVSQKNIPRQTLTDTYLGHSAMFKLLIPNKNLTSYQLCSKISDQNVAITIFQACYIRKKHPSCIGHIFWDTLCIKHKDAIPVWLKIDRSHKKALNKTQ